jgi:hypothetical protein
MFPLSVPNIVVSISCPAIHMYIYFYPSWNNLVDYIPVYPLQNKKCPNCSNMFQLVIPKLDQLVWSCTYIYIWYIYIYIIIYKLYMIYIYIICNIYIYIILYRSHIPIISTCSIPWCFTQTYRQIHLASKGWQIHLCHPGVDPWQSLCFENVDRSTL